MGAIKTKSDETILDNNEKRNTPEKVREVMDVVDSQVEAIKDTIDNLLVPQDGQDGLSAYEIWLDNGNTGTEQVFLDSLVGNDGQDGQDGQTPDISQLEEDVQDLDDRVTNLEDGGSSSDGSGQMDGDLDMNYNDIVNIRTLHHDDGENPGTYFELANRQFVGGPLNYAVDYSDDYTARSFVDKAYVDAKTAGTPSIHTEAFTTGSDAEVRTITHNLNSTDVLLLAFEQASGNFKKIDFSIVGTMLNVTANSFEATFQGDEQYKVIVLAF